MFWPFLFCLKSCAGKSNATHPSKYVVNHQHHQTPRNSLKKLLQAIWTQIMNKNGKTWHVFSKENGLRNYFWWVFGDVWTGFLHAFQFPTNFVHELHLFKAKKFDWFLALFWPFFPARPTSASYTHPLKVLSEGSMVQNLPFGSKEAPKTITGKKNSAPPNPKLHSQPSVQSIMNCNLSPHTHQAAARSNY